MCGIFGYIGPEEASGKVLQGLHKLEYRGYDSAGLAGFSNDKIICCKSEGKVRQLELLVQEETLELQTAIAHTRWATHGKPTTVNAHPHLDSGETLAVVHNGIIENFDSLKAMLIEQGVCFASDTDTEVISHLIATHYQGDLLDALKQVLPLLQGAFALAIIHKNHPNKIFAVATESPLAVGVAEGEAYISSDTLALQSVAKEVIHLHNREIAVVQSDQLETFDASMSRIIKSPELLASISEEACKGDYEHFTLKEIHEQPRSIKAALASRFSDEYGTALLDGLNMPVEELLNVKRILILACGTSWHAGLLGGYMLEDQARIPVQVEVSSEYRYRNPIVLPGTLVITISQSGETADTIAAMRELQAKGAKILSLCNVHGASIPREADGCLYLRAGPEIGVCSTKAFTSQVVVLALLSLLMARMRHMDKADGQLFLQELKALPEVVQEVLDQEETIRAIAKRYANYDNFFFLGRSYMYPTALEGALKLKEISYINANGYPAGEMKHGPIALISENCPTIAFCMNKHTLPKMISNLMEVKARSGLIVGLAAQNTPRVGDVCDDMVWLPSITDTLAPIPCSVAAQLFAYHVALERGAEIDQPRNLAKSVTVE